MNSFKILQEKTIEYTSEQQLFLMLIQDNTNQYLEINDRHSYIGKIYLDNTSTGLEVLASMQKWIAQVNDFVLAKRLIQLAFSKQYSTREAIFLIHLITGDEITFLKIKHLKSIYFFEWDLVFTNDKEFTRDSIIAIHIKFPKAEKMIGKFMRDVGQNEFRFIINT